jgi:hypothetical protein
MVSQERNSRDTALLYVQAITSQLEKLCFHLTHSNHQASMLTGELGGVLTFGYAAALLVTHVIP